MLQLEAVACKDWLTNKVDRSVTGRIARQQCQGQVQLPLSDCGVVALDYRGYKGIATAIGHAPQAGLASPEAGSVLSVAEALTNIVWAPLAEGMDSISLSANWMWPCRAQKGEDARLYSAVKHCQTSVVPLVLMCQQVKIRYRSHNNILTVRRLFRQEQLSFQVEQR